MKKAQEDLKKYKKEFEDMMVMDLTCAELTVDVDTPSRTGLTLNFSAALPKVLMTPEGKLATDVKVSWMVEMSTDEEFTKNVFKNTFDEWQSAIVHLEEDGTCTWPYQRRFYARVKAMAHVTKEHDGMMYNDTYTVPGLSVLLECCLSLDTEEMRPWPRRGPMLRRELILM